MGLLCPVYIVGLLNLYFTSARRDVRCAFTSYGVHSVIIVVTAVRQRTAGTTELGKQQYNAQWSRTGSGISQPRRRRVQQGRGATPARSAGVFGHLLSYAYENLWMGDDESMERFTTRVVPLVNGIHMLIEKLEEISVVRRFLRAATAHHLSIVSEIDSHNR